MKQVTWTITENMPLTPDTCLMEQGSPRMPPL